MVAFRGVIMDQVEIYSVLSDATLKSAANVADWNEAILYIEHQEKSVGFKSAYSA